jgi:hypothetical protein
MVNLRAEAMSGSEHDDRFRAKTLDNRLYFMCVCASCHVLQSPPIIPMSNPLLITMQETRHVPRTHLSVPNQPPMIQFAIPISSLRSFLHHAVMPALTKRPCCHCEEEHSATVGFGCLSVAYQAEVCTSQRHSETVLATGL